MPLYYTLDDNDFPVPCEDIITWARWMEEHSERRVVAYTTIGYYSVSTVFLGIDHNWMGRGDPILWETMIFPSTEKVNYYQERYSDLLAAREGHGQAVVFLMCHEDQQPVAEVNTGCQDNEEN